RARSIAIRLQDYWHFGSPSTVAGAMTLAAPMKSAHRVPTVAAECVAVAFHPGTAPPKVTVTPADGTNKQLVPGVQPAGNPVRAAGGRFEEVPVMMYLRLSAKYASWAVVRFRRSDFMDARYAFCFVLANFGMAIAAKMPMITTTISSSMSVKPFRFMTTFLLGEVDVISGPRRACSGLAEGQPVCHGGPPPAQAIISQRVAVPIGSRSRRLHPGVQLNFARSGSTCGA